MGLLCLTLQYAARIPELLENNEENESDVRERIHLIVTDACICTVRVNMLSLLNQLQVSTP